MKASLCLLTLFAMLLGSPVPATAQEIVCPKASGDPEYNKNEARSYYNMGNTFFNMKQYEKSAASFVCVINLVPYSIMARYRLGKSYDALGRFSLAREQYQWILADASDEADVLKSEVQKRLDEIKALPDVAEVPAKTDPAPGDPVPGDPAKDPPGGEKTGPGDPEKSPAPTKVDPPGTTPMAPRPALTSRWWFWTGVGATALFTATTLFSGWKTVQYQDRWETNWRPADRDSLEDYRLYTDLALTGALISAAALGVAILLDRPASTQKPSGKTVGRWFVLPACGPDRCGVSLSWAF